MGGCFSVSISLDQVLNHASNRLCGDGNYLRSLEKNIDALQTAKEELRSKRNDLSRRVASEEYGGRQRLVEVQFWISGAEAIEEQVDVLLAAKANQVQRLCLCGYCSKRFILGYRYGKRVSKMLEKVKDHKSKGVFEVVIGNAPTRAVALRPIQQPTGQEVLLENAWGHLMDDGVGTLGLYGMGGVGKTTLLKQINNKLHEETCKFDIVIWVVVSSVVQVHSIQEEIAEKLGFNNFNSDGWKHKKAQDKAADIYNVLTRKRFVLLLDDIWSKVDLTEIGVPSPTRENGCKVVFTTRSKEVCGRMGANPEIEVECLSSDDAWDLFKKKVGEITLSHPQIPELAQITFRKCRGLPLALNVIGETMSCKRTVQEWRLAIDTLTSSAIEFSGMEDEILPILKYSYDNLRDEQIKLCFQYCALFPEDYEISKEELAYYRIGEGIIDENEDVEKAMNKCYEVINTLICSCLLMDDNIEWVKMHDVTREMALWVASDLGKQTEYFVVQAGFKLHQIPKVKNWSDVRWVSLMQNEIDEISTDSPQCFELETLLLQDNEFVKLSGDFFMCMSRLLVLDLSRNKNLNELPEEISELVSLRYLNLSGTKKKRLSVGIQKVEKLIHLNVESAYELETILGISCLSSLKILRMFGSGVIIDVDVVKELQELGDLQVLTIKCVTREMNRGREKGTRKRATVLARRQPSRQLFLNLRQLKIFSCRGARDLTRLMMNAPNLVLLTVSGCENMEEIVKKEKAEEAGHAIPFEKLEFLLLSDLPELRSIYWHPLRFPCLISKVPFQAN
ncbi:PREDICTED: LOW QUALITY PROTEIN: probable disease resistance protein At5g63020 [Tarenaya hassleriana]|uniref:LOW QUALITY PROTEIN: probable disease resistance protein At5g63020 n=1 Tax=Tarenaya hassleriana TaxID=28532 RepID=UPI0008FCEBB9|nr:PREDICTED: LOW QUALITY PROTEIN: probable disease resistance protein At5g63020 [Tarenaya hassleriana]